ncbi:major facilitator superfamily domain-containing protein [Vararia minispora EC-137]|uniref:Major facilitator superfamily domain-containing protein n=1 Tax=Vararia minispora EC-137 TaxID=1314806 RepID=A0ACB8QRL4_9AGAM|nr:major facilitator superfamily domain-containing protein [Vararia minispora EC-137]
MSDASVATNAPLTPSGPVFQLNERRQAALARIDRAPFSWFHVKVWIVAGVGFFTDAYDIFAIGNAALMLGTVYGTTVSHQDNHALAPAVDFGLKVAAPLGNLFGQLIFGWLADVVGRKRMYGVELIMMVISTFAQAMAGQGPAVNIIGVITAWRFLLGIGVGGDYPLSAIIVSEFAATRSRGRLMTAVFASQGWGNLTASLVALIVLAAYKTSIIADGLDNPVSMDRCWRLLIGLGCVPGVFALYLRLTVPETPRFTMDVERNIKLAVRNIQAVLSLNGVHPGVWRVDEELSEQRVDVPRPTLRDFTRYFRRWKNLKMLIGAAYSWFALDIAFYGLGLNTSKVLTSSFLSAINIGRPVAVNTSTGSFDNAFNLAIFSLLISGSSLVPGYWASFVFIDSWGRRPIQLMGFSVLSVLFLLMGFGYNTLTASVAGTRVFVFIYCLANFFQNFGPNVTTFVYPGELFPTRYRSTAHGISAASGKLGAVVAQSVFFVNGNAIQLILRIMGFIMISGILSTLLLPETKGKSLEQLSNESQKGFVRGSYLNSSQIKEKYQYHAQAQIHSNSVMALSYDEQSKPLGHLCSVFALVCAFVATIPLLRFRFRALLSLYHLFRKIQRVIADGGGRILYQ